MQKLIAFQTIIPIFGGYYISQWVHYNALKPSFLLSVILVLIPVLSVFLSYDFFTWLRETMHIGRLSSVALAMSLHLLLNQVIPLLAYFASFFLFSLQEAFLCLLWVPIYINRVCWSIVVENQKFLRKNVWLQLDNFATTHTFIHAQLCVFIGVSMFVHLGYSMDSVWDFISANTERLLPPSIAATRYFVKIWSLTVFLSAATIFTIRPVLLFSADVIFGLVSILLVADVARFSPIWSSYSTFSAIPILFGIYLLSFHVLLPTLSIVSNQGYLYDVLRRYYNWASTINGFPGASEVMKIFGILAAYGTSYLLGKLFSIDSRIYSMNGILLALKYANHPRSLITAFLVTTWFYITSMDWPIIFGISVTAVVSLGIHILTVCLVMPILWPLAGFLAAIFLVTGITRIIVAIESKAQRICASIIENVETLIAFCFFEQSSFDPLVLWISMTISGTAAVVKLGKLAVPWKFDLESYFLYFMEKYLQFHTVERDGYLIKSSTSSYTPMKGWNTSWMNFTLQLPDASDNPYLFATCLVSAIFVAFVLLNLLVLCGKRLGDFGGIFISIYACFYLFLQFRVDQFFQTRYQLISDLLAMEGALLLVLTLGFCYYGAIKWLCMHYHPHIIRVASLPYESLVIWQTWAARTVWKKALICLDVISMLWQPFSTKLERPSTPKYVRPRRYV